MKHTKLFPVLTLLPVLGALAVFAGVNVADYCRYRYIMNLDKHLDAADFEEMARIVGMGNGAYSGSTLPAVFQKIGARSLRIHKDALGGASAIAVLYERGKPAKDDWRVFCTEAELQLDIGKQREKIFLLDNFAGRPRQRTLWTNDPALEKENNPQNRILTLSFWPRNQHWIVMKDAILHQGSGTSAKQPLTIFQSDAIGGGIDMIPPRTYGKWFDAGIMDGASMELRFSPDGGPSAKDILVNNTWCEDLEPLLKMLRQFAPHGAEIPTKETMTQAQETGWPGTDSVPARASASVHHILSIEDWRACPPLETDWWIVWPKLFFEKPEPARETPPE